MENSSWQWTRRWLLQHGIKDDPNSKEPHYFIKEEDREHFEKITHDIKVTIQVNTNKDNQTTQNPRNFFNI